MRQSDRFLPVTLTALTLANNNIEDLNEISLLVHLENLQHISIANNPCVNIGNTKMYPLVVSGDQKNNRQNRPTLSVHLIYSYYSIFFSLVISGD